jgi:hypothetical protein
MGKKKRVNYASSATLYWVVVPSSAIPPDMPPGAPLSVDWTDYYEGADSFEVVSPQPDTKEE